MRTTQRGAGGVMIGVVLVLVVLVLLAVRVLSRVGDSAADRNQTLASLSRAADALDQYVAGGGINARLPCPADPSADTGVEVPASAKTCTFPAGTLPWRTIGLRRDDAYDAWGRKLSYRVYTDNGSKGSLVQPGGPSLVNCYADTHAGGGTDSNGQCSASHTTSSFDVLKKKGGLDLTDFGTDHTKNNNDPTAYVVISHGPTGLGGYTVSGALVVGAAGVGPSGDERNNTRDTGPFTLEAWSDPDTAADLNTHFDDLLVYRTVSDLAKRAGLDARAWGVTSLTFDPGTIALGGGTADPAVVDTGTNTLTYGATTITGFSAGTATDISYDTTNGNSGIGVYGGGSASLISSATNDSMHIGLGGAARQFAITLNDFNTFFGVVFETVELKFYNGTSGTPVLTSQKLACSATVGQLSTLSVNVGQDFTRVEVTPLSTTVFGFTVPTTFAISAISVCRAGVTCTTAIAGSGVTCP